MFGGSDLEGCRFVFPHFRHISRWAKTDISVTEPVNSSVKEAVGGGEGSWIR